MEADLSNRIGAAAERFVPGEARGEVIETEHLARYWWATSLVAGKRVLDAGCGVGYGTALLKAADADEVVGVDIAADAVAAATASHAQAQFMAADIHELPFADDSFDVVVCFEVIEHVEHQDAVIDELARVLAPPGVLAISSPNRGVYPAGNPHHVHEFTSEELRATLVQRFAHVELRRQHDWVASAVLDDAQVAHAELRDLEAQVGKVLGVTPGSETYVIGLASDEPLPALPGRMVLGSVEDVQEGLRNAAFIRRERATMQAIEAQLRADNAALGEQLAETEATLRRIHASPLWRLSKPLRALGRVRR